MKHSCTLLLVAHIQVLGCRCIPEVWHMLPQEIQAHYHLPWEKKKNKTHSSTVQKPDYGKFPKTERLLLVLFWLLVQNTHITELSQESAPS